MAPDTTSSTILDSTISTQSPLPNYRQQNLERRLNQLSEEAKVYRINVKDAKTVTKKEYYHKKLVKATSQIIKLLNEYKAIK